MTSFDNARWRCSAQPTSSELRESRRATELESILSETIRPRRVSLKRVGEDDRELLDLLLTEVVEYRRVRRPLCDMGVTYSEPLVRGPITVRNATPISQTFPTPASMFLSFSHLKPDRLTGGPDQVNGLIHIDGAAHSAAILKFWGGLRNIHRLFKRDLIVSCATQPTAQYGHRPDRRPSFPTNVVRDLGEHMFVCHRPPNCDCDCLNYSC